MEKNYSKEVEEYYGQALDVISDFQNSKMLISKVEDKRNLEDKIFLYFAEDIRLRLPKEINREISNSGRNELAIDLLAYMVKKYKRGYTKKTITEINESYLETIDDIFMPSIRNNQNEILKLMKSQGCSFDEAVLQFYDEKTRQYFCNNMDKNKQINSINQTEER